MKNEDLAKLSLDELLKVYSDVVSMKEFLEKESQIEIEGEEVSKEVETKEEKEEGTESTEENKESEEKKDSE